jgi:hypothetical protein
MAKSGTQKRVNHHSIKDKAHSKNWERFVLETKGESTKNCADQEKKHALKNVEESEDPGRWVDNAEMDDMIKHPHPDPKECKNS